MQINKIDEKDNLILNLLSENGRMSYSEIGKRVGLTRTAVKNRITVLEETGIISGYKAVVNPLNLKGMMTFIVNIESDVEHFDSVKEMLLHSEKTVTVVQTTGNCHLLSVFVTSDMQEMKASVSKMFKGVEGIRSINAHAVMDVIKGSVIPENYNWSVEQ